MKVFNTTGLCIPSKHYMVDIHDRLVQIKAMVDDGKYFTINRGRQYGKTTTLSGLRRFLMPDYEVISLDFQSIGNAGFATEERFVQEFCRLLKRERRNGVFIPDSILRMIDDYCNRTEHMAIMGHLFDLILDWCEITEKPLVLMIDEVDSATNNQVFLDFLAQLRENFLSREDRGTPAFHSVILAGVTDIRNLKRKIRPDEAHKVNSPWNIAADFNIDMSLSASGIKGMLDDYEADHHTGMDTAQIAEEIRDYTSGYPFLVSRICQLIDTDLAGKDERFPTLASAWTCDGVSETVRKILTESNLLFDSLMGKIQNDRELYNILYMTLFSGELISFNPYNIATGDAAMYGFIVNENGKIKIANRIFETMLYNYFLSEDMKENPEIYSAGDSERLEFVHNGHLLMDKLLAHYAEVFEDIYGGREETFDEAEGRRRFLLYLRPIINGTGNYYVEAQTRDSRRMDLVIDYLGERHIVELKIWRGQAYHEAGKKQLSAYLDSYHLDKGYLLTYNFNKEKQTGLSRSTIDGKLLIEATV